MAEPNDSQRAAPPHLKVGAEFLARPRYRSNIPTLPFDPKSLRYPFPEDMLHRYELSSLEKYSQYSLPFPEILLDLIHMGVFDDESSVNDLIEGVQVVKDRKNSHIDPRDEGLLVDPDSLGEGVASFSSIGRASGHVPFLRRSDYTDGTEAVRPFYAGYSRASTTAVAREARVLPLTDTSHEGQLRVIESTFEACAEQTKDLSKLRHPRDPARRAVAALTVLPDMHLWPNVYAQVYFEDHLEKSAVIPPRSVMLPRMQEDGTKTLFCLYSPPSDASTVMNLMHAYELKTVNPSQTSKLIVTIDRATNCAFYTTISKRLTLAKHRPRKEEDSVESALLRAPKLAMDIQPISQSMVDARVETLMQIGVPGDLAQRYVAGEEQLCAQPKSAD